VSPSGGNYKSVNESKSKLPGHLRYKSDRKPTKFITDYYEKGLVDAKNKYIQSQ